MQELVTSLSKSILSQMYSFAQRNEYTPVEEITNIESILFHPRFYGHKYLKEFGTTRKLELYIKENTDLPIEMKIILLSIILDTEIGVKDKYFFLTARQFSQLNKKSYTLSLTLEGKGFLSTHEFKGYFFYYNMII